MLRKDFLFFSFTLLNLHIIIVIRSCIAYRLFVRMYYSCVYCTLKALFICLIRLCTMYIRRTFRFKSERVKIIVWEFSAVKRFFFCLEIFRFELNYRFVEQLQSCVYKIFFHIFPSHFHGNSIHHILMLVLDSHFFGSACTHISSYNNKFLSNMPESKAHLHHLPTPTRKLWIE